MGVMPKYRSQRSTMVGVSGGTTEATMIALMSSGEKRLASYRFRRRIPYSSLVFSRSVQTRQW